MTKLRQLICPNEVIKRQNLEKCNTQAPNVEFCRQQFTQVSWS